MENIGIEHIYLNLKLETKNIEEKNIISSRPLNDTKKYKKKIAFPEDDSLWLYNSFQTYINDKFLECPVISPEEWEQFENDQEYINSNIIEIKNQILLLKEKIDYDKFNNNIITDIILKGESSFWIFLHDNEKFSDKTTVIILSKKDYLKRCFVSLGTFINKNQYKNKEKILNDINKKLQLNLNDNNISNNVIEKNILYDSSIDASRSIILGNDNNKFRNIDNNSDIRIEKNIDVNIDTDFGINNGNIDYEFVVFKKQELVEEISLEKKKEKEKKNINNNDKTFLNVCRLKIYIFDDGHNINIKIRLNDGEYENEISEKYFKSTFDVGSTGEMINKKENKIMFAGSGEGCGVLFFHNEIKFKDHKYYLKRTNDCQCCNII